jgi:hypothetical protein
MMTYARHNPQVMSKDQAYKLEQVRSQPGPYSNVVLGLNPPFGVHSRLAVRFIAHRLDTQPRLIVLIVPQASDGFNCHPPLELCAYGEAVYPLQALTPLRRAINDGADLLVVEDTKFRGGGGCARSACTPAGVTLLQPRGSRDASTGRLLTARSPLHPSPRGRERG